MKSVDRMHELSLGEFIAKSDFFDGKRVLIDFMDNFASDDFVLVGNTHVGFVPVGGENHASEGYKPRSFRFNVGALHQYILTDENETRYIDELAPGDCVMIGNGKGYKKYRIARIKIEIRPFCKLTFAAGKRTVEVILQSDATACALTENGIKPINELRKGDKCYVYEWGKATHLGTVKEEYCEEL